MFLQLNRRNRTRDRVHLILCLSLWAAFMISHAYAMENPARDTTSQASDTLVSPVNDTSLVDLVNPFIGVRDDVSNCVVGPQLPFGSINPSPQTPNGSHDGYAPDEPIRGFGQLQVSGTGWGKYGQVFISPQIGLAVGEKAHDSGKSNELAKAYEYSVTLDRYGIGVDVTPSVHSAIYRFTFPKSDSSNILIDITHNIPMDIATFVGGKVTAGEVTIDSGQTFSISGDGTYSGGFGDGSYQVFFYAEFDRKPTRFGTWINGKLERGRLHESLAKTDDRVGAYVGFSTSDNEEILMKIAVSLRSVARAEQWLGNEIPDWNFDAVRDTAKAVWNRALGKIEVEGGSDTLRTIFYTALYHSMLMPRDRTGDIKGYPEDAPLWDDEYAVWDTWRTLFPLMELIDPDMVRGNINSFITRYKVNHKVRDAFIAGIDMDAEQGGDNVDNVIADAYVKGLTGVNWEEAYEVVKHDADFERKGFTGLGGKKVQNGDENAYRETGWIPAGIMSCSKTLEFAYNDYCAAEVARGLDRMDDYRKYLRRSTEWENLWDPKATSNGFAGFIVPKRADGTWVKIDPKKNWGSWHDYFYEGSSWTYSYFVPHEFQRLVSLCGGRREYVERLEHALENNLIDFSNEPSFLTIPTFDYARRPDLASFWIRKVMESRYTMNGYPGNEDSGAMSSWFVFAAMGLLPNAGQDFYYLHGPSFTGITIHLENGRTIRIVGENASAKNIYVQSLRLNGIELDRPYITQADLENGAVLDFVMGGKPSYWGK